MDAEDAARAKEREREIRLLGINVVSTPADDEIAAETERVMNLTPTGGNDGDDEDEPATKVTHWRDLVARSDDPLRTLTAEHNHTVALIGVRNDGGCAGVAYTHRRSGSVRLHRCKRRLPSCAKRPPRLRLKSKNTRVD